jgi:hypothetical protein
MGFLARKLQTLLGQAAVVVAASVGLAFRLLRLRPAMAATAVLVPAAQPGARVVHLARLPLLVELERTAPVVGAEAGQTPV